ncbi:methyltransferase domain-containing protein [Aliikangiella coralliicola]|uniref:Methyltransferase domain-containing protein n=1 Tax=Aliikangiella coralliicola TaxID=2592383 RepID=A0A545UH50_9GAMM|nr:methyltransferase domain-containing protein [Aliikangiella coralliicola]TQV88792.1 methyltransferase domain-containing protein [Aliikangiella coralliicola]
MASASTVDCQLTAFNQHSDLPIVDLRSEADFVKAHIKNSSHFPAAEIATRLHELPKRNHPIRLCGSAEQLRLAENLLEKKGFQVAAKLEWNTIITARLQKLDLLVQGIQSKRLWSPAPIVERFHRQFLETDFLKPPLIKSALDIGCGSGRDSVYLAQQGWQVNSIDYLPGALDKLADLAKNNHVNVNGMMIDLQDSSNPLDEIQQQFDLILVVRYLHRPLLPQIKQKIKRGGYVVYQTFMQGCEAFGKPKNPKFLLKPGELAQIFSDFEILLDEVEYLEDGRPTNVFIAKNR